MSRKNKSDKTKRVEPIKLLLKYHEYENIIEHSKAVARVSLIIAKLIKENNPDTYLNLEDVKNAALLHDIDKTLTLKENRDYALKVCKKLGIKPSRIKHGILGYEILKREGLRKYGLIAKQHHLFSMLSAIEKPKTLLSKIIYYADKRTADDKLVSINKRFEIWDKKYGRYSKVREKNKIKRQILKLEKELLTKMGLKKSQFEKKLHELLKD